MADKVGAYGTKASEGSFRKKWDTEAYTAKAREADSARAEHAKASSEALAAGKKPPRTKSGPDLPKPTKNLEARTEDLGIERNLNKTVLVSQVGGKGQPGFYCELCKRTLKDSIGYLDHVNGRSHLARLGQTTQVRRSSLQQVRDRITHLRSLSATRVTSRNFDFSTRLSQIAAEEATRRSAAKDAKKRKREEGREREKRERGVGGVVILEGEGQKGAFGRRGEEEEREREGRAMEEMMGFGGFGGGKK